MFFAIIFLPFISTNPTYTIAPTTPVTFTQIGQIIYSGDHYILPIQLNVNDLLSMTEPLLNGLTETRSHFDNLVKHLSHRSRGHPYAEFVNTSFPPSMQAHLALLMGDLEIRINNMRGLLASLTNYGRQDSSEHAFRRRRSPFDFVGSAASYLFGLVDHSEFQKMEDIIAQLADLSEKERKQLNLHTHILNVTSLHIEALEQNQKRTRDAILTLDANVRAINLTISDQQDNIYTLDNSVRMISALSYATSAMNDLDYIFSRFSSGVSKMTRGILAPEILAPDRLAAILDDLDKVNLRALWPSTDAYIPLFYKFSTVVPVKTDTFMFYVLIPLYPEPNTDMSLYRVTALPYPFKSNVTISYGELPSFFAIAADHSLHTDLSNADLENCRQLNSLYFCNEVRPLYKGSHPSCTFALYTNVNIAKHCAKHVSPNLARPLVIRDDNRWLYATSYDIYVTVVCPAKQTATIKLDIGVGSIEIPQKCRINSPFAQLPTAQEVKRLGVEMVNYTLVRPFNISLTEQEHETIHLFNDTLYKDLLALTGSPIPLHSLGQEIGQLRLIQKSRVHAAIVSRYAFSISITVTALILCMIICGCYIRRVLKEDRDDTGRPRTSGGNGNPLINLFVTRNRDNRENTPTHVTYTRSAHPHEHQESRDLPAGRIRQ